MFAELQLGEANANCCGGKEKKYNRYYSERRIIYWFTTETIFNNLRARLYVSFTNITPLALLFFFFYRFGVLKNKSYVSLNDHFSLI